MSNKLISFREDIDKDLRARAEQLHVSVTWLVNQLCREGLDRAADEIKVIS